MGKSFKTLVTGNVPKGWTGDLANVSDIIIWSGEKSFLLPRIELLNLLPEVDAVVNFAELRVDKELLDNAPKLKIIANASIGYDNLDLIELTERKIWASNSPGYFNFAVAEYVIAGMLYLSRRIGEAERFVRNGNWDSFEPGRWDGDSLREKTLGIVGMGAIGSELTKLANCIGMKVRYFDIFNRALPGFSELEDLLSISDFVSINVPLSPSTKKMVNQDFIDMMKKDVILINTSRGAIIDESALMKALLSGRLKGAVLDVFENEPSVPEMLRKLDNVILTPHIAGGTKSSRKACMENAFLNVYSVFTGNKPLNPLNNI